MGSFCHRWFKRKQSGGFTLVEVIVAALIFSMAVAGVLGALSALRGPAMASREQVTAAFVGEKILEDLRASVDAETWASGGLTNGVHNMSPVTVDGIVFTPAYTVANDPDGTMAKKVTLTVTW